MLCAVPDPGTLEELATLHEVDWQRKFEVPACYFSGHPFEHLESLLVHFFGLAGKPMGL